MAINYAEKFLPIIDEVYRKGSATAVLDTPTDTNFNEAGAVKIMKVDTAGLGDYSKTNGYPEATANVTWETLQLTEDRGVKIDVDRIDDMQALSTAFGAVTGQFVKGGVSPELDAYRFAKYASTEGVGGTSAALTEGAAILDAIDTASSFLDDNEVPDDRVLFVNTNLKKGLAGAIAREWGSDGTISRVLKGYNEMPIIYVPSKRFYTAITLNSGENAWGYTKAEDATNINFMMLSKSAVVQAIQLANAKTVDPDTNQSKDAWSFMYRLFHDCFVYDNKKNGVYVHKGV